MRRIIAVLLALMALFVGPGAAKAAEKMAAAAPDAAPKTTVSDADALAIVNGERITRRQVADALMLAYGREALNLLIDRVLIEQEASKSGVTATDQEVQERIEKEIEKQFERVMAQFRIKTRAELAEFIKRNGGDIETIRKRFGAELTPQARTAVLEDKILRMRVKVAPEEVRERYQKLYGPRLEAQQIVVATKREADELAAKVRAGADFAILAREYSLDAASKGSGGKLQPLSADSQLGRAMADLGEGQVSDPVPMDGNFHILKLNKRVGSESVKFSAVEAKLKADLYLEKADQLRSGWRAALKDKADIRVLNPLD